MVDGRSSTLTYTFARRNGEDVAVLPGLRVILESPGAARQEVELGLAPVTVGSGSGCTLVCADSSVSRRHCQLSLGPRGVRLRDLDSKNGTFVGGVEVADCVLPLATLVTLGSSTLRVTAGRESVEIPLASASSFGGATGSSVVMRALFAQLERAARTDASVLLQGESGTGKEVLAHALHARSPRAEGAFVTFDAGSTSGQLIEAELFGHERGAFTGAESARVGLLAQAHGGTLLLDEVGELPLSLQPRLLRVLQERRVRPLGATEDVEADFRVIAATNHDLRAQVKSGSFREDLYHRLAALEFRVPPLRERREDLPLLLAELLRVQSPPATPADLPAGIIGLLQAHDWPGNVRELKNVLQRLTLFPEQGLSVLGAPSSAAATRLDSLSLHEAREAVVLTFERSYLRRKLAEHGGNISATARAIDTSRQQLHRLIARHDLHAEGEDG